MRAEALQLVDLLRSLSDPDAYPHPVPHLHVVQTHASCVFLTGAYVYKIKKPVNFGFLDYSTLEKRRACCERELVLNRRLCPEVYLEVVGIGWQQGKLRVGVSDDPVEWAVRMRQLPEEDMLPVRLAAGTVTPLQMERIADLLAEFHRCAATNAEIAFFGSPEAVGRNVEENFAQTETRLGAGLSPEHLVSIRNYSRRFLAEQRNLFVARVRNGFIRDGHGDLRAQNLCLHSGLRGGVQILDCIEFNDRFRYGDVAADLAYLAMDLDLAGQADLRCVLIDRYVSSSGDEQLRELLPFYQCYRAYVRGKIALLAAEEVEILAEERQSHRSLAAAAFDLSRSYAERFGPPALFITVGYSGSGKSVVARELARRLPATRLATDEVRKELGGLAPTDRLSATQYSPEERRKVYVELNQRARQLLAQGEHVILDGTFLAEVDRAAAGDVARTVGAQFWVLDCRCADAVIRERLRNRSNRGADASDASLEVYEAQRNNAPERPTVVERQRFSECWVSIDTELPAGVAARKALNRFWTSR